MLKILIHPVCNIYVHSVNGCLISAVLAGVFEILVMWASVAHSQHAGLCADRLSVNKTLCFALLSLTS